MEDNREKIDQNLYAPECKSDIPGIYNLEDDDFIPSDIGSSLQNDVTDKEYSLPDEEVYDESVNVEDIVDESDEPEAWQGGSVESKITPLGILWRIMSNPTEGCKSLKRAKFSIEKISGGLFYPIIIIAGLSNLTAMFYDVETDGAELAINITFTIITFFFGYFTTLLAGGSILCKEARAVLHTYYGKEFVMYCVSTLALFYIMFRLLPMAAPVIAFFPIWTIYIVSKGIRLFRVPKEKEVQTIGILSTLIIGSPLLWDWLLDKMV